jgi:hypothetical protein
MKSLLSPNTSVIGDVAAVLEEWGRNRWALCVLEGLRVICGHSSHVHIRALRYMGVGASFWMRLEGVMRVTSIEPYFFPVVVRCMVLRKLLHLSSAALRSVIKAALIGLVIWYLWS